MLERSSLAAPVLRRAAPGRRGLVSRDNGCPGRSGLGRSLRREQSRRECRASVCPAPDPEGLRRLLRTEGDFRSSPGSRPGRGFRGTGCSGGPQSCSWGHPPAEVVGARAASIRPAKSGARRGLAGHFDTGEDARQLRRPASWQQRAVTGSRESARDRPRTMEGASISERPPGVDAPAADRDQAAGKGTARGTDYQPPAKGARGDGRQGIR